MFYLGLALSLAYIPGITGNALPTGWAILSLTLPLILWSSTHITQFHWSGAAFLVWAVISAWWAPEPWDAVWRLWQFGILALAFHLGSTDIDLPKLWKGLAAGLTISSGVAIAQAFGYHPIPTATATPGIFYNGIAAGSAAAMVLIALASERLWWWMIGLLPGLVLSQSRGAIGAAIFGLILINYRRLWLLLLPLIALFLISLHPSNSDIQRFTIWAAAIDHLEFMGNGAGSFLSILMITPYGLQHPEFAHNDYLQFIFEFGIGCLPLLTWFFLYAQYWHPLFPITATFFLLALVAMPFHIPVAAFIFAVASGRLARDVCRVWLVGGMRRSYLSHKPRLSPSTVPAQLGIPQSESMT